MDFRIPFSPPALATRIQHTDKVLLTGSCFTEHIGRFLNDAGFRTMTNPNGIIFNPISITDSLTSYVENRQYKISELFFVNDGWHSWDFHSSYSHTDSSIALQTMNASVNTAHQFLLEADWLIITLGSAWVYEWIGDGTESAGQRIVANCHKVPNHQFKKRLLSNEEIIAALGNTIYRLQIINPRLKILFTISPVRHTKDGLVENNRSKATLVQSVHHIVDKFEKLFYFPAYEIVIDELRDYRFYAEDMIHPNETAIKYVSEQFQAACIAEEAYPIIKELARIKAAVSHRPFNQSAPAFQHFLQTQLQKLAGLQQRYQYLHLDEDIAYFKSLLQ